MKYFARSMLILIVELIVFAGAFDITNDIYSGFVLLLAINAISCAIAALIKFADLH